MSNLDELKETVGFVGAGNMATALIRGLVRGGAPLGQVLVSDVAHEKAQALSTELGITAEEETTKLVERSDIVVLCVKPGVTCTVAREFRKLAAGRLWISVAAGVSCAPIEEALGQSARVIRAMPNTPALVGQGATGLCPGTHCSESDLEVSCRLLGAVGICEVVDESVMDALTALSGSGPAFIMLVIESMTDGAVRAGLPRPIALRLAAQTVRGAATLLQETGKHPGELKDMVTSPAGTTIAGVEALEAAGLRNALISAVTSAAQRSRELGTK